MKFKDIQPTIVELAAGQRYFRVQLTRVRTNSVRKNGMILAPPGILAGRFCVSDEATAYLADSQETAIFESVFRREVTNCSLERLSKRSLVLFESTASIRLADLRPLAAHYPVFQSKRIAGTQQFSRDCRDMGLDGVIYSSAQQPAHSCICLFESGIAAFKKQAALPLMAPGTRQLLNIVCDAARRAEVPLV